VEGMEPQRFEQKIQQHFAESWYDKGFLLISLTQSPKTKENTGKSDKTQTETTSVYSIWQKLL
jgi:hypothetical protein